MKFNTKSKFRYKNDENDRRWKVKEVDAVEFDGVAGCLVLTQVELNDRQTIWRLTHRHTGLALITNLEPGRKALTADDLILRARAFWNLLNDAAKKAHATDDVEAIQTHTSTEAVHALSDELAGLW